VAPRGAYDDSHKLLCIECRVKMIRANLADESQRREVRVGRRTRRRRGRDS